MTGFFIRNVKFNCDGKVFTYIPDEVNRDNDSSIWEWFDERVTAENEPLFQAIANASKVKMKINGDQYYDERVLSNKRAILYKSRLINNYKSPWWHFLFSSF